MNDHPFDQLYALSEERGFHFVVHHNTQTKMWDVEIQSGIHGTIGVQEAPSLAEAVRNIQEAITWKG